MPLLEQVLEQYPNDVKLVFKHFPLRNHSYALPAAMAAMAAGEQGKFWEFHDRLFQNFSGLDDLRVDQIAQELELDLEAFQQARNDPEIRNLINRDLREGQTVGVRGTPSIFVNGRLLTNRSLAGFRELIDRDLAARRTKGN